MIDKTAAETQAMSNAAAMAGEFIEGMMGQGHSSDFATWPEEAFDSFVECVVDGYVAKLAELGEKHKPPF